MMDDILVDDDDDDNDDDSGVFVVVVEFWSGDTRGPSAVNDQESSPFKKGEPNNLGSSNAGEDVLRPSHSLPPYIAISIKHN
jgi:hypothetical protein